MALGNRKGSKKTDKTKKKDAKYVTLMSILEGEDKTTYAKANTYKGRLIWQEFGGANGDDEENSKFYEIKTAFIGKPHESAPDFVLENIVVNLKNPKAAQVIDE